MGTVEVRCTYFPPRLVCRHVPSHRAADVLCTPPITSVTYVEFPWLSSKYFADYLTWLLLRSHPRVCPPPDRQHNPRTWVLHSPALLTNIRCEEQLVAHDSVTPSVADQHGYDPGSPLPDLVIGPQYLSLHIDPHIRTWLMPRYLPTLGLSCNITTSPRPVFDHIRLLRRWFHSSLCSNGQRTAFRHGVQTR